MESVPAALLSPVNETVLAYLDAKSAHSDVAEALLQAVAPLGDVQKFCPNPRAYKYQLVSTRGVIFGLAVGMSMIAFRLDPVFKERALITGGKDAGQIGREWVSFLVFQNDWPAVDLTFWARKAYVFAREGTK